MEQATGEVDIIFKGGNGWVNDSTSMSSPRTLWIPGGAGATMTEQDTAFPAEGHAPTAGTSKNLYRALMGGTPML